MPYGRKLAAIAAMALTMCSGARATTFGFTGGFTTFTVQNSSLYEIVASGAAGGQGGGHGAVLAATFYLTVGQVLTIAVGGAGDDGSNYGFRDLDAIGGGGGGGGTFVVLGSTPLLIAGGGGGGFGSPNNALTTGSLGGGGSAVPDLEVGAGGGGFYGDGDSTGIYANAGGGGGYGSGLYGGYTFGARGGFGGGGAGNPGGGGGGGGATGGNGGVYGSGGGGSSYIDSSGTLEYALVLPTGGNGLLTINDVPEPASLMVLSLGAVGAVATRTRRRSPDAG